MRFDQRTREQLHDRFVESFHVGDAPSVVSEQELDRVELNLKTRLPASYRSFMSRHGIVHTPRVLDMICERNVDHPDVQDFLEPQEAIDDTRSYWAAGMPNDIIGIASDCMGNMIGFRRRSQTDDDAPVVFFDHDFVTAYNVAPSFDEFLAWYLDHLKGGG